MKEFNLALDTTSEYLTMAISRGGRLIRGSVIKAGQRHSEILIPTVSDLIEKAGATPRSVGKIAVVIGPGSFTGIRIGLTFARTFASTMGIPLVPVNSFEALAASRGDICRKKSVGTEVADDKMLILINALLPLVHWAVVDVERYRIVKKYPPQIDKLEDIPDKISSSQKSQIKFFGGSALAFDECVDVVRKNFFSKMSDKEFLKNIVRRYFITHPSPWALAKLSELLPPSPDPSSVEPLYLKDVYLRK